MKSWLSVVQDERIAISQKTHLGYQRLCCCGCRRKIVPSFDLLAKPMAVSFFSAQLRSILQKLASLKLMMESLKYSSAKSAR